jgi:2'-hydroxyisoflavone reductase
MSMYSANNPDTNSALTSRRDMLRLLGAAAVTAGLGSALTGTHGARAFGATQPEDITKPGKALKILILGGTGFLGPACVDAALARGHTLTLFNRGKTEKRKGGMYPDLEKLLGDRDPKIGEGLKALEGDREWDAVIDTSAYVPRIAKASAELLAKRTKHYTLISTVSVYKDNNIENADETAPVGTLADPTVESMGSQFENYGPLKALCEAAAEAAMPGRVANVRPGFIVGPGDPTPRFPYWPARIAKGGNVAVPGKPTDPVQIIDVRDLGDWVIHLLERNITGVFNALGPVGGTTMGQLVNKIKQGVGSEAEFTFIDPNIAAQSGVQFPIWLPHGGETVGFHTRNIEKAVKNGFTSRDPANTAKATLDWLKSLPEDKQKALTGAVSEAQEKTLLEAAMK